MSEPHILPEDTLTAIENRPSVSTEQWCLHRVLITEAERDALIQTVRAAWAERDSATDELKVADDALEHQVTLIADLRNENAALREQLGQATDALRRQVDACIELQSRLAQVEKERNIAVRFLVRQSYEQCAELEHGCDGWHTL